MSKIDNEKEKERKKKHKITKKKHVKYMIMECSFAKYIERNIYHNQNHER